MMKKNRSLEIIFLAATLAFSGCMGLKTRSEVNPSEQSFLSRRKQQDAQKTENGKAIVKDTPAPNDPEETIRT